MKAILFFGILVFSGSVLASDKFTCEYATADISASSKLNLIIKGSASVVFDGQSFTAYRPDGTYVITPPLTEKKDGMLFLDDKTKVFAASLDKSNYAVSDRIKKTTEQWAKCEEDKIASQKNKDNDEIKRIESMSSSEAEKYFLHEKHAFTTNCLVWEDVTMITGKYPAIIMAGSVNMGKSPRWNGREYSFTFNGGSMIARFVPSEPRHKFVIQGGDKFYGCGPSEIDHNYD